VDRWPRRLAGVRYTRSRILVSRDTQARGERPLFWIRSSLKDLETFPAEVQEHVGYALSAAQYGGKHISAKPWKGDGSGVMEVVEDFRGDTFRAIYTVRFAEAVYVLQCVSEEVDERNCHIAIRQRVDSQTAERCDRGLQGAVWPSKKITW
jgi:phage-related protein